MAINILLTDTQSPLGNGLRHRFESTTFRFVADHPAELSWTDDSAVREYLDQVKPNLILNSTGWGEGAAVKPDLLADGAACLGRCVAGRDVSVVHLSSHRAFHGERTVSHSEYDLPSAQTDLAKAFVEAENELQKSLQQTLILRCSWVLSSQGGSLLARLLDDFSAGRSTQVCDQWRGSPVLVGDVVRTVHAITLQIIYGANNWGVMHFGSSDVCSELVFARKVLEMVQGVTGRELSLQEIESTTDNSAVLELRRIRECFGIQPRSWRQGLKPVIQRWLRQHELVDA